MENENLEISELKKVSRFARVSLLVMILLGLGLVGFLCEDTIEIGHHAIFILGGMALGIWITKEISS